NRFSIGVVNGFPARPRLHKMAPASFAPGTAGEDARRTAAETAALHRRTHAARILIVRYVLLCECVVVTGKAFRSLGGTDRVGLPGWDSASARNVPAAVRDSGEAWPAPSAGHRFAGRSLRCVACG